MGYDILPFHERYILKGMDQNYKLIHWLINLQLNVGRSASISTS